MDLLEARTYSTTEPSDYDSLEPDVNDETNSLGTEQ